jgi:iron complex outermembrane receptor protein
VDWYKIDIADAITAVGAQQIIDMCYGFNRPQNPAACDSIVKAAGATNLVNATIYTSGINAQTVAVEGVDYEVGYRADLARPVQRQAARGDQPSGLLISQRLKDETDPAGRRRAADPGHLRQPEVEAACSQPTYVVGPSRTTVTTRYLGKGRITNWATTTAQGLADNLNHVDAVWYFDIAENYDLDIDGHNVTLFGVVENLFNRDPEQIPGGYLSFGTNNPYDLLAVPSALAPASSSSATRMRHGLANTAGL